MTDNKHETKNAILGELESIKELLQNQDDIPLLQDDIPLLSDAIDEFTEGAGPPPLFADNPRAAAPVVEQQTLFEDNLETKALEEHASPKKQGQTKTPDEAKKRKNKKVKPPPIVPDLIDENPFLPQHIRDRLHTNKTLVDIIKESPQFTDTSTRPTSASSHTDDATLPNDVSITLIDDLVAEFMPKIEQELRHRLLALSKQSHKPFSGSQNSRSKE